MSYTEKYFEIYENLAHLGENKTEIALAIFQEVNKDRRVSEMNEAKIKSSNEPASYKQIYFLKQNGIEFKEGLSKSEADKLIEEFKNKQ